MVYPFNPNTTHLQLPTPNQSLLNTRKFTLVPRSTRRLLPSIEHGPLRLERLLFLLVLELLLDTGVAICAVVSWCVPKEISSSIDLDIDIDVEVDVGKYVLCFARRGVSPLFFSIA